MTITTSNEYTGDGSTSLFSITFPYIEESDVVVTLDGTAQTITTHYVFSNSTTISMVTAPAVGEKLLIKRNTSSEDLKATFFPGSAIRARDLNDNFTQNLYVSQESTIEASTATAKAEQAATDASTAQTAATTAQTAATSAQTSATAAQSSASSALTQATSAQTAATSAQTSATSAATSAQTAATEASNATTAANTATNTANTALSTANSATSTANSATTTANTALSTANSASTLASQADTKADTAIATANTASTTANTASTNASAAVTTANSASATATAAQNAVANALFYSPVANVSSIPSSPSNGDRVEVSDSTGIQSFTPLNGLPTGFTGSSDLVVRLEYDSTNSYWDWVQYFASDPESRYYSKSAGTTNATNIATKMPIAGGTFTGLVTLSGAPTASLHAATRQYVDDNKLIAIDAGNFDNGSSTISSTLTIDGGSF